MRSTSPNSSKMGHSASSVKSRGTCGGAWVGGWREIGRARVDAWWGPGRRGSPRAKGEAVARANHLANEQLAHGICRRRIHITGGEGRPVRGLDPDSQSRRFRGGAEPPPCYVCRPPRASVPGGVVRAGRLYRRRQDFRQGVSSAMRASVRGYVRARRRTRRAELGGSWRSTECWSWQPKNGTILHLRVGAARKGIWSGRVGHHAQQAVTWRLWPLRRACAPSLRAPRLRIFAHGGLHSSRAS